MPWKPSFPGERPTLGHYAAEWMIENLAAPDHADYVPFYPTVEQYEFLLNFYEIDPITGKRVIRRAVLSRARGWGKSPFLAAIAILEGLGDVVPAGWDANGRPVGRPWRDLRMPLVVVAAASEEQTRNAWMPLQEMVDDSPVLDNYPGMEPLGGRVNLPYGEIRPVSTSVTSSKGYRPVCTICDQTEQWNSSNGGNKFMSVLMNNATKVSGSLIESPNAYIPGENSVAERSAEAYFAMKAGKTQMDRGLLYDHREAPADTDLTDRDSLIAGLRYAYGCSSDHPDGCVLHDPPCQPGWAPVEGFLARIWDLDADEQESRSDFLNQITHASDQWVPQPVWKAAARPQEVLRDGDMVTLGFDGSRGRAKGKPDATALVACRVEDGYTQELAVWEADDNRRDLWADWQPPVVEVDAAVGSAFDRFNVVGFFADPAKDWRSYVNKWEADYGSKVVVKATHAHPFEWWMTGGRATRVEQAVEEAEAAIRHQELVHSGSYTLTRHVLNARRRIAHSRLVIAKDSDHSMRKIDAAVALVLAWAARSEAVAAGVLRQQETFVPFRVR